MRKKEKLYWHFFEGKIRILLEKGLFNLEGEVETSSSICLTSFQIAKMQKCLKNPSSIFAWEKDYEEEGGRQVVESIVRFSGDFFKEIELSQKDIFHNIKEKDRRENVKNCEKELKKEFQKKGMN